MPQQVEEVRRNISHGHCADGWPSETTCQWNQH